MQWRTERNYTREAAQLPDRSVVMHTFRDQQTIPTAIACLHGGTAGYTAHSRAKPPPFLTRLLLCANARSEHAEALRAVQQVTTMSV